MHVTALGLGPIVATAAAALFRESSATFVHAPSSSATHSQTRSRQSRRPACAGGNQPEHV